jgi:beta-galactosidase/beta-glucuronidase
MALGWYRRRVSRPASWVGQRIILHFGAVHHMADVWLNGNHATHHVGGYLPFEIDVTDLFDEEGQGLLVVRVEAPVDKRFIPHGKQRSQPPDDYDGCSFTPSSGIWQTVWLEPRPSTYIAELQLRPSADLTGIRVRVNSKGPNVASARLTLELPASGNTTTVDLNGARTDELLTVLNPVLWSPDNPLLYDVKATLQSDDGVDRVVAYTGLRRLEWHDQYLHLNGSPIYLRGVLDQGFWPAGGHTAPSDSALVRDLELARAAGFNLVRKHIKLEDPRWLYWADRMGMLVWAEPPSTGRFDRGAIALFEENLVGMVARDGNHPSIAIWGAYNEEWGLDWDVPGDPAKQEALRHAYQILRTADPTRPVVDNSGWAHVETDLVDWHFYADDVDSWSRTVAGLSDGEDDGFAVRLGPDHLVTKMIGIEGFDASSKPLLNGEYGGGTTSVERGWHLRWQTQELRRHARTAGYIYTELYDVEYELAGIYTYDRRNKNLGDTQPELVNATTTLIVDIAPTGPGRDIVTNRRHVGVPVRISHHGNRMLEASLHWALDGRSDSDGSLAVIAEPLRTTEPFLCEVHLPEGTSQSRVRLWLLTHQGERAAETFVDVVIADPALIVEPIDGGVSKLGP